jgi:NADPH:quinone reductase-like Zn-dependent oxidoreductase
MARTRNGSYAELVTVPAANVVSVKTMLSWADLGAIPEAYATAWTGLIDNLALKPGETVIVRGATSSVGQAAVNIAVDHGASVIATTRREERGPRLRELGASQVLIDDGDIAAQVRAASPGGADCVLDLVGNAALRDSLRSVRARGRICQLGFLGGLAPVAEFSPLADLPSGVQLSTIASAFVLGGEDYPLDRIPLQDLVGKAEQGRFDAKPAQVFPFEHIADAHRVMEAGQANGKLVVTLT